MSLSVAERALCIATFRHVEVRLMQTAAAWTPTTPELEVKVLLGRHIWDFAQHADALGKRTFELRLEEQATREPDEAYTRLLDDVAQIGDTPGRLGALYDVVLPGMERRYQRYVAGTHPVLDAPSVVVVEAILRDLARQRRDAERLCAAIGMPARLPEGLCERDERIESLLPPRAGA